MARPVTDVEADRDARVRTLPCPICEVEPGQICFFGRDKQGHRIFVWTSHTGRYNAAAQAELVPQMAVGHG